MQPEMARDYINSFEQRFRRYGYGQGHLYLAYHAAFPLALTPDLLYLLWANFQRDSVGRPLNIPWIAVADLLLSGLCNEVGHELYEIETSIRDELLRRLVADPRFREKRLKELAHFLVVYVKRQLERYPNDPDMEIFAETQMWTILAYTQPNKAAKQLALRLRNLVQKRDRIEQIRMASVINTLSKPLVEHGFEPLVIYAKGMADFARGEVKDASVTLSEQVLKGKGRIEIEGVNLPIPKDLEIDLLTRDFDSQEEAAEYLVNQWRNHKCKLVEWIIDIWWREVLLLTIRNFEIQASYTDGSAFIKTLLNLNDSAEIIIAAAELAATGLLKLDKAEEFLLESARQRLVDIFADMELLNSTSPPRRAAAGIALAHIGDLRPNVMTVDGMEFCYVPAGIFWMGSNEINNEKPLHKVDIPYGYWMARYPVTNAQFQEFVQNGGYTVERFWQKAKTAGVWNSGEIVGPFEEKHRTHPYNFGFPYNLPNHPVVGVTWYEALAFTYWLTERWSGTYTVKLPSEAEWEKAARGGETIPIDPLICPATKLERNPSVPMILNALSQRSYPWDNKWISKHANYKESAINHTNAVGCFPSGKSPYGNEEMSGNVYEWTRSLDKSYPYRPDDGREAIMDSSIGWRIIRGGSYYEKRNRITCNFRSKSIPFIVCRGVGWGFRVAQLATF